MGLKYAKDAVKIGFANIAIDQNAPNTGYFADVQLSEQEQKELLGILANEDRCFTVPTFIDDTKYTSLAPAPMMPTETVITESVTPLPVVQDLTLPPLEQDQNEMIKNIAVVAAGALGAYFLIKIVS